MITKGMVTLSGLGLVLSITVCQISIAEVINDTQWRIESGDSVYSIARKIFPNDTKKQARFRRELVKSNPDVFRGNANLMRVGNTLELPAFAVRQSAPEIKPAPEVKMQSVVSQAATAEQKPVTPDPEEEIGRVVIKIGELEASNRGVTRILSRHSSILKGDTLRTSQGTRTQIRMKDGALISLRPNTELYLSRYHFNGKEDGTESSILELLRGGFRTITGAIGHKNKSSYQVRTSLATIGIRGTHYGLMLCSAGDCQDSADSSNLQDGLYGGVVDGSIIAENQQGRFSFNNDQYFHISTSNTPPVETLVPPPVFQDAPLDDKAPASERRNLVDARNARSAIDKAMDDKSLENRRQPGEFRPAHIPVVMVSDNPEFRPLRPLVTLTDQSADTYQQPLPPKAPDGSGLAIAFTQPEGTGRNGVGAPIIIAPNRGNNIFLENYVTPGGAVIANLPFAIYEESIGPDGILQRHEGARLRPDGSGATYVVSSIGGNAALGVNWGRWNGNYFLQENDVDVIHDPDLHYIYSPNLTLPTTLANLGGLRSRIEVYNFAGGTLPTNHLGLVAASNPQITADVDFVNHQLLDYSVSADVAGINWFGRLNNRVDFTQLDRSFQISGACHNTVCNGEASFLFVGDAAGGAMSSYSLVDTLGSGISGSALLTPLTLTTTADNYAALFAFQVTTGDVAIPVLTHPASVDNIYLSGGNPVIANDRFTDINGIDHYQNLSVNPSALLLDTGSNNTLVPGTTVNWGRWDSATAIKDNQATQVTDLMFIHSNNLTTPAQLGGLSGTALFSAAPADFNARINGITADVSSYVNMNVNFTTGQMVDYTVHVTDASVGIVEGRATAIAFQDLNRGFQLTASGTCTTCSGSASVAFVGAGAEGAITSFSLRDTFTNDAQGTALMTRP